MKNRITKETKNGILSASLVDEFSDYTEQALAGTRLSHKDVLRFRMSVDTAMCTWLDELGDGALCSFELGKRFGRITIAVSCEGKKCNPQKSSGEEFGILENSSFLQSLGLSVKYSYENGVNRIELMPASGLIKQLIPIAAAFVLGIGIALIIKMISPEFSVALNTQFVDPIFSALMNLLRAIASPLIFLAVLSGIYGIGDVTALGTIGKKLMSRFVLMTFVTLVPTTGLLFLLVNFKFGGSGSGSGSIKEILDLVVQFIPSDIVSPFLNGNMLQIITISVVCGIVMLILGDRVSELTKIIDQIYSVVQLLMEAIGSLVPIFIFMSMFSLVLSDNGVKIGDIVQPVIIILGTFAVMALVVYPLMLNIKYKLPYVLLMKKLLPTFLIAFSTASSAAAFATNVETCEQSLGISSNITRFGVPLGQVTYMPFAAAEYLTISAILAVSNDVHISLIWFITAALVAGILAVATPPIPGGAMTIFTVLFLQLGIPEAALPLALGIDLLIDYIVTAGDIMCLQEELVICADKTGLLDCEKLLADK